MLDLRPAGGHAIVERCLLILRPTGHIPLLILVLAETKIRGAEKVDRNGFWTVGIEKHAALHREKPAGIRTVRIDPTAIVR